MLHFPENGAAINRVYRAGPIKKAGDHAKISAAAPQRPKKVVVLGRAGGQKASVGQDHIGFNQIINR